MVDCSHAWELMRTGDWLEWLLVPEQSAAPGNNCVADKQRPRWGPYTTAVWGFFWVLPNKADGVSRRSQLKISGWLAKGNLGQSRNARGRAGGIGSQIWDFSSDKETQKIPRKYPEGERVILNTCQITETLRGSLGGRKRGSPTI